MKKKKMWTKSTPLIANLFMRSPLVCVDKLHQLATNSRTLLKTETESLFTDITEYETPAGFTWDYNIYIWR